MIDQNPSYRSTANRVGWCLCIMVGMMYLTQSVWSSLFQLFDPFLTREGSFLVGTLVDTLSYLSYFMVPAILFYPMSRKKSPAPIKCEVKVPATIPLFILGGMAVILIFAWINGILMQMIGYEYTASSLGTSDPEAIYLYITVALAPAFCEEFLFRGVIYGNLRRYGLWSATLISALLFALMHQSISQTLYTFAAGIVMALTYELTGSIWCSTFLHMFNNLYSVVQEVIAARLGPACYRKLNMADGIIIVLGRISMILLCLLAIHKLKKMCKAAEEEKARAEEANLTPAQDGCDRMTFGQVPCRLTPVPESGLTPDKISAKGFFAPGMIAFLVMALVTTVIDAAWGLGLFTGM